MINYDEKMLLNCRLVIKMGIDQIGKRIVKSMSVKKFSHLGQFIRGFENPCSQNQRGWDMCEERLSLALV